MQIQEPFTATSGNRTKKFRIDQNVQKVLIKRTCPAVNGQPHIIGDELVDGMPEKISLEIQGLGSSRISQGERIPLALMAAFAQFGEGVISEVVDGDNSTRAFIPVVLASVGVGLSAGDQSFLLLENAIEGATYTIFAIQTPTVGNLVYNYVEQQVLAGDKVRKIEVSGVQNAIFRSNGLEKLVVYYRGGQVCTYDPLELQFLNSENNDIEVLTRTVDGNGKPTYSPSGSMYSQLIVLKTESIQFIEVFTDANLYEYLTIAEIDRNAH